MNLQNIKQTYTRPYFPGINSQFNASNLLGNQSSGQQSAVQSFANLGQTSSAFAPVQQSQWGIAQAIQELVSLVKVLLSELLGRENTPSFLQPNPADILNIPGVIPINPDTQGVLRAQTRPSAKPSQTKGVRGLFHKGGDWLVNKGYNWINDKLGGSLDSLNSVSVKTFEKIWTGGKKIATSLFDKAADIGSTITNGLGSIGSSIVSGIGSLFGF